MSNRDKIAVACAAGAAICQLVAYYSAKRVIDDLERKLVREIEQKIQLMSYLGTQLEENGIRPTEFDIIALREMGIILN